ncbi:hypothetical protein EIP91_012256 [Steccherinum ochraceum]|uniref:F-box domain-containing protein n=1 Tax=Steccherinum ochraceum TaxID=92696 RepID=A0A4R0RQA7_9APHY|nr:hypothetical protein EIP91_012256 [Steccherinum ochraceum]
MLVYILKALRDDSLRDTLSSWSIRYWLGYSQVCQQWRQVMLTTPSLWDTIIIRNSARNSEQQVMNQVSAFLSRSGTCPLDVSIVDGRDWLHLFKGHLARVRGLRVSGKSRDLETLLPSAAPHLESLRIMMVVEVAHGAVYPPSETSPPTMFNKHAPNLRRLWVRNIGEWKNGALNFSNLTRLCLEGVVDVDSFPRGTRANYLDFLNNLESSPQLEVLLLRMLDDNMELRATASPSVWRNFAAASTLQKLVFIGSLDLNNFLSSVRNRGTDEVAAYPNLQQLWVCDEMDELEDACDTLLRNLSLRPRGEIPQALREIYLKESPPPGSKVLKSVTPRLTEAISNLRDRFVVHFADDEADASSRWEHGIELPEWPQESLKFGTGHSCPWRPEWKSWTQSDWQPPLEDDVLKEEDEDDLYAYALF